MCAVGFIDLLDASIVNIALPQIRTEPHFSVQSLQWVASVYLLTYGGFCCSAAARLICSAGGACLLQGRRCLGSRRSSAVWLAAKGS